MARQESSLALRVILSVSEGSFKAAGFLETRPAVMANDVLVAMIAQLL